MEVIMARSMRFKNSTVWKPKVIINSSIAER